MKETKSVRVSSSSFPSLPTVLSVPFSFGTHFDPSLLQRMNRIRYSILKLVLNRRRSQQVQVLLDQLCDVVQGVSSSGDLSSRSVVEIEPFSVLLERDLSDGEAESSKSFGRVVL